MVLVHPIAIFDFITRSYKEDKSFSIENIIKDWYNRRAASLKTYIHFNVTFSFGENRIIMSGAPTFCAIHALYVCI